MSVSYVKFCPRCQTTTSVETQTCVKCGHQFRTHFQPPVSEKTIAMTAAALSQADTPPAEAFPRERHSLNGNGHRPAPARRRLRPRLLLVCLVAILAAGALFGGLRLSHGRDRVAARKAPPEKTVAREQMPSQEVVIQGDAQGRPAALATQSPNDLERWQATASAATSDSPQASDNPAHVRLYLSGQIALLPPGTHVRALQGQGAIRRVQILDGPHQGATGYISSADIAQPTDLSLIPHQDLPADSQ